MAWIESHTVLIRHRKVLQMASSLSLKPVVVIGHLHALWHAVLEQQEDGDLSAWPDEMIAHAAAYEGDAGQFVSLLQSLKWLDDKLIHDWLDYAGRYLTNKYRTGNPKKLKAIYRLHKTAYKTVSSQTKDRQQSAHLPNLTRPNQPNLTKPTSPVLRARQTLEAFVITDEIREWAKKELHVEIPEDVLTEFKEHWRAHAHKRSNWDSTFKNRIRQLVGWKVLVPGQPIKQGWQEEFLAKEGQA